MPLKVLVFESDPSFAGELRTELAHLGLDARIVDDGNAGLIAAGSEKPDLILLSIELPRMNGFSVCNKLKKDPALKDVPLIIMSSESSDETFEQHKKLRTRAEDYVHKPIAFGELLEHMRPYVQLDGAAEGQHAGDDGISIDDEIELEEVEAFDDVDDRTSPGEVRDDPPQFVESAGVDAEVEAFADSAFDHLLDEGRGSVVPAAEPAAMVEPVPFESPYVENGVRRATSRPPLAFFDADADRLRAQLDEQNAELQRRQAEVERLRAELSSSRAEIDRLGQLALEDNGSGEEVTRLQRELDELRLRVAAPVKASGVSSRDFLDLREALNKKDKEILGLRDQISRKEKELLDGSDTNLGLEREKADLDDRIALLERDLQASKFAAETAKADKEQAAKRADDWRSRSEKFKAELDAKAADAAALQSRFESELAARETRLGQQSAELAQRNEQIAAQAAQFGRDLEAAEERSRAALEEAQQNAEEQLRATVREAETARDRALAKLREESDLARAAALASREYELRQTHEARSAELEYARAEAETRLRDEIALAGRELESARQRHDELERKRVEDLDALRGELDRRRDDELSSARHRSADERGALEARHADEVRNLSAQHAEVSADLAKRTEEREALAGEAAELRNKLASVEAAARDAYSELGTSQAKLATVTQRLEELTARWEQNKTSLERAKDALAAAVSQIEEAEARGIG